MLATIARPTAVEATTEEPTVTYNAVQRQIAATVIASFLLGEVEPTFDFEAPLIAIPGPGKGSDIWTVTWTLEPGPGVVSAIFDKENGISIPQVPSRLRIRESFRVPDQPSQWQVTFQNNVISANSFNYVIKGDVKGADDRWLPFSHDPTIVVTQDPIG